MWVITGLTIASFAVVFAAQFSTKLYLEIQAQSIKSQIVQLQGQVNKQENAQVKAQVKGVNDIISDYKNLADASPKWSRVIKAFVKLPPDGVKVSSFSVEAATKQVNIVGTAPTRELVIQLYNNILADTAEFSNINYPLENIASPTNVNYHFTFTVKDSLMQ
jgi:hypothetical protein